MSLFDGKFTQEDDENEQAECEPVAYMDAGNTCAITVFTIGKLQERGNIGSNFPYELWPTKLYTIPQDQSKKIAELEKINSDCISHNKLLNDTVAELEAKNAKLIEALIHANEYLDPWDSESIKFEIDALLAEMKKGE